MIIPFNTKTVLVTSPYADRTLDGVTEFHPGYDMVGVGSWDVTAAVGGKVVQSRIVTDQSNITWQWGNYVCIKTDAGQYHYYCHMASRTVAQGQTVKAGDKLGVMGNTGYSRGAHLHFEVRDTNGKTTLCPETVLGIPNAEGTYELKELTADDYIQMIVDKVGYDDPMPVIEQFKKVQHPFLTDLWRKLYEVMK